MSQVKRQHKTPEKQVNEVETTIFPEKEFKMIVKMTQNLGKRMEAKIEKRQELFTKDLKQTNTMEEISSRRGKRTGTWKTKQWKSLPQNRMQEKKRLKRNEDSLSDLWANIKHTDVPITGVPEGRKDLRKYWKR